MNAQTNDNPLMRERRRAAWLSLGIVVLAALAMGLPTINGGFVGGDDYQLALNHVYVNHPSFSHALKLFAIVHRDLYQPLPMLSFSAEFALAYQFDLFEAGNQRSGAWLFHLDNVLLHTLNVVLVWLVLRRLDRRPALALIGGLLFAVHPLQVEVVAWLNGRMMLMSTLFALASLLALSRWLAQGRRRWAVLTVLFVLACSISKVRVGLPILLLLVPYAQQLKLHRRFWVLWLICGAITGAFAVLNIWSTSEAALFAGGAEHLSGPRAVRVLISLAWYLQHMIVPTGLAAWHGTTVTVQWLHRDTALAALICLPALALLAVACWKSRGCQVGVVWFFATLTSTLPIVPARNILAADRYMYLPIIGLCLVLGIGAHAVYDRWLRPTAPAWRRGLPVAVVLPIICTLLGMSWFLGATYATSISKTERVAQVYPNTQQVWERVAWAYYNAGKAAESAGDAAQARAHYNTALEYVQRELRHNDHILHCEVYQLMGMTYWRLGDLEQALAYLTLALETDPRHPLAYYRLAQLLEELGRFDEALAYHEHAAELSPTNNPLLNRLAELYRRLGRPEAARKTYEQSLGTNAYEVSAILGLAEIELEKGTEAGALAAVERLQNLLAWMPEDVPARINLGVALSQLGRTAEAVAAYEEALARDPHAFAAALNLALIRHHEYAQRQQYARCVELWLGVLRLDSACHLARAQLAWSRTLAGDYAGARAELARLGGVTPLPPLTYATEALLALHARQYDDAAAACRTLGTLGPAAGDVRQQLLHALGPVQAQQPELPWTYALAAELLYANGQAPAALQMLDLCEERAKDTPACAAYSRALRAKISASMADRPRESLPPGP